MKTFQATSHPVEESFATLYPDRDTKIPTKIKYLLVVNRANPEKLGYDLALRSLCHIATNSSVPKLQQKALNKLPEFLDVNPDHEFHTAEAEAILHLMDGGKNFQEIRSLYGV